MELKNIRQEIDTIDNQLTELLMKRMETVAKVAEAKKESGKAIRDHAREREIINRVTAKSGEEYAPYIKNLFRTMFDLSCNYQSQKIGYTSALGQRLRNAIENPVARSLPNRAVVACQGTEGAYAQQACEKMFEYPSILYFSSFNDVFSAVEKGMCKYGILPLENSTAGSVTQVYDLMEQHAFHIVGACRLRIDHCLLRKKGATGPIRKIVSHDQALRQCSDYLENQPDVITEAMENTAVAAEYAANAEENDVAVIASSVCADIYNLEIVKENISNVQNNYTRFICIARDMQVYPNAGKVSIMFNLPHAPGALGSIISRLTLANVNLTKLESRPIPGREFEFRFFFDFEADMQDPEMIDLICELENRTEHFVFLGAYAEK